MQQCWLHGKQSGATVGQPLFQGMRAAGRRPGSQCWDGRRRAVWAGCWRAAREQPRRGQKQIGNVRCPKRAPRDRQSLETGRSGGDGVEHHGARASERAPSLGGVLEVSDQIRPLLRLLQPRKHHLGACTHRYGQQACRPWWSGRGEGLWQHATLPRLAMSRLAGSPIPGCCSTSSPSAAAARAPPRVRCMPSC